IYRIVPKSGKLRPIPNLTKISAAKLAALLDTPNGTERDRIHQELICRGDKSCVRELEQRASRSKLPAVRLQALCVLDGLNSLNADLVEHALADAHANVRANAVRLSERFISSPSAEASRSTHLWRAVVALVNDPSDVVRFQVAL